MELTKKPALNVLMYSLFLITLTFNSACTPASNEEASATTDNTTQEETIAELEEQSPIQPTNPPATVEDVTPAC